jgi:protein-tyrosine-phosphatase
MAEAIYNKMTNSHDATSAGTYAGAPDEPEGQILSNLFPDDSPFMKIMDEHGMDVRKEKTKRLTPEMIQEADVAISMAEEPFIPDFLRDNKKVIWWDIANNASFEFIRETYEELSKLVQDLIAKRSQSRRPLSGF